MKSVCAKCRKWKLKSEFYKGFRKDGTAPYCKECKRSNQKASYRVKLERESEFKFTGFSLGVFLGLMLVRQLSSSKGLHLATRSD